jgi:signal peptidase II
LLPPADDHAPGEAPAAAPVHETAPRPGLFWYVTLALIGFDQITKAIVVRSLSLYESVQVIPGLLDFTHVRNEGVAFGFLNAYNLPYKTAVTTGLAFVALAGIAWYARSIGRGEWIARLGLSMILGGAVGNLIDRLILGSVVDFVDVYWDAWHFWAFNVADASITMGAVLVFVELLLVNRHASDPV